MNPGIIIPTCCTTGLALTATFSAMQTLSSEKIQSPLYICCHPNSQSPLEVGCMYSTACDYKVHQSSFDGYSSNEKEDQVFYVPSTLFVHGPCRDFSFIVEVLVLHPVYSEEKHISVFFFSIFDHISTSQRPLLSSSLLLQIIVFTPLILFTLSSNTDHCQKMLLPEQVKWKNSNT